MNKNQQLRKRLLTYSHLGELSFSEEEIQRYIKLSEDKKNFSNLVDQRTTDSQR